LAHPADDLRATYDLWLDHARAAHRLSSLPPSRATTRTTSHLAPRAIPCLPVEMDDFLEIREIEVRHASEAVAARVRTWFASPRRVGILDGSRSVRLPHPEKRGFDIKIKGAGLLGGADSVRTICAYRPQGTDLRFRRTHD